MRLGGIGTLSTTQVRPVLLSVNGTEVKMEWDYKRCDDKSFFTVAYPNGSISCEPCPLGGDCTSPAGTLYCLPWRLSLCIPWRSPASVASRDHPLPVPVLALVPHRVLVYFFTCVLPRGCRCGAKCDHCTTRLVGI